MSTNYLNKRATIRGEVRNRSFSDNVKRMMRLLKGKRNAQSIGYVLHTEGFNLLKSNVIERHNQDVLRGEPNPSEQDRIRHKRSDEALIKAIELGLILQQICDSKQYPSLIETLESIPYTDE